MKPINILKFKLQIFIGIGYFVNYIFCQTGASFNVVCTTLVDENVDPVVLPGKVGYGHGHRIVGANGFYSGSTAVSANPANDPVTSIFKSSTGTTCNVPKDLSAYWQPILYYQLSSNNNLLRAIDGPAKFYYNFVPGVQGFPDDFKVIVGKATKTKTSGDPDLGAVHFEYPVGTKIYDFPTITCSNTQLRAHVFFPNCGKVDVNGNLLRDPVTGRYVLEYPIGFRTGAEIPKVPAFNYKGQGCPAGYKIFPQLHQAFHYDVKNICVGGQVLPGRFVWSNGNTDGRGLHADFLNGWDPATMNAAITLCLSGGCPANGNGCPAGLLGCVAPNPLPPYTRKEGTYDYKGPVAGTGVLPSVYALNQGAVPSWGWNSGLVSFAPTISPKPTVRPTSVPTSPTATPIIAPTSSPTNVPATLYLGCYGDNSNRAMSTQLSPKVASISVCRQLAATNGYSLFGLQFAGECWVSNNLISTKKYGLCGVCTTCGKPTCNCAAMKCASGENCGDNWANAVYQIVPGGLSVVGNLQSSPVNTIVIDNTTLTIVIVFLSLFIISCLMAGLYFYFRTQKVIIDLQQSIDPANNKESSFI